MKKVIVYIDGFNIYHAIDDLKEPKLKWLNLWSLSQSLLNTEERLVAVKYFSAYQTKRPDAYARHRKYISALQNSGVTVQMGNFKFKDRQCRNCNSVWKQPEEKETDVHLAISIVADAFLDAFEKCILISADSDLLPPKKFINTHFPSKKFFVATPPGRFASARSLSPNMEITKGRIKKHLFPSEIRDNNGNLVVSIPKEYM